MPVARTAATVAEYRTKPGRRKSLAISEERIKRYWQAAIVAPRRPQRRADQCNPVVVCLRIEACCQPAAPVSA